MQKELKLISNSPEATRRVGAALAEHLQVGDIIGLIGDLGAGKTVFVQGMGEGLQITEPATSPSFVLMHIYTGRLRLVHVDLYRLSCAQAEDLGIEEYLANAAGVIEWAERLRGLQVDLLVKFLCDDSEPDRRTIDFSPISARGEELAQIIETAL